MEDFAGTVAVITGGASGLGFALARQALALGGNIVIADIRAEEVAQAGALLAAEGGEVLAMTADVTKFDDMVELARRAVERFGKVNLLFNNAGVFASGLTWETSIDEYEWVIGVNLKSVIHGIKAFVPAMIAQGDACHVINISSAAGLSVNSGFCTYSTTKHAVLALSEALYLDLQAQKIPNVGVTIAMPGFIKSQIMLPEKSAPDKVRHALHVRRSHPVLQSLEAGMNQGVDTGMSGQQAAALIFEAVKNNALYVLPNADDEMSVLQLKKVALGRCGGSNGYAAEK